MDKPEAILQAIRDCEVGAEVIIHNSDGSVWGHGNSRPMLCCVGINPKDRRRGMNIDEFIKQRNTALINLDLDWIIKNTNCKDRYPALVYAHKARYEATSLPNDARHASRRWLQKRGYKRLMMTDFLPGNQLPE